MKRWLMAIRNGVVVLLLLTAYSLVQDKSFIGPHMIYALGIAGLWTGYELVRVFGIQIDGIKLPPKPTLLML